MIKIAHLTSVHFRYDTRIFLKQCISLASNGYDVTLIVADGKGDENKENIAIYDVGRPKNRIFRMLNTTRQVYREAIKLNADVYHLHDPELIPIGLKLIKRSKKVIFDSHEHVPEQLLSKHYLSNWISRIISRSFDLFESLTLKKFSAIIAATPHICNILSSKNSRVVTINNYPIINELSSISRINAQKQNQVCFVGGVTDIRGIKELLVAFRLTKNNTKLVLAGLFSDQNLKTELQKTASWNYVKDLGFLNRTEVSQVLAQSIAGIVTFLPVPNHINAQPNKMFEYMSAGLPIIASNFPLWKEIIEAHNCGICVDPTKPQEIANAIDFLIANPKLAKDMGENGKQAINEKFNWTAEEKKLFDLYESLLK